MTSKRRSATSTPLPDPVFFLDRNLGAEKLPTQLKAAGFQVIVHQDHYRGRQDVQDPEIIAECGKNGWFLLTADSALITRWAQDIKNAAIGVFCQSNNNDGPLLWGPRICNLKKRIIRAARTKQRPFAGVMTVGCKIQYRKF